MAIVAKGVDRVADLILDGVEGKEAARILVSEEGGPCGHPIDDNHLLCHEAGEECPDVVSKRVASGDLRASMLNE